MDLPPLLEGRPDDRTHFVLEGLDVLWSRDQDVDRHLETGQVTVDALRQLPPVRDAAPCVT